MDYGNSENPVARNPQHTRICRVYMEKKAILGFVVGNCEQWENTLRFELKTICVRPDKQAQGIGTNLLHQLVDTLLTFHVSSVYLLTLKEGLAEAFYTKNGFHKSHRVVFMSNQLVYSMVKP